MSHGVRTEMCAILDPFALVYTLNEMLVSLFDFLPTCGRPMFASCCTNERRPLLDLFI